MTAKGGRQRRDHDVPLSTAAIAVLETMKTLSHSDVIFPGERSPFMYRNAMNELAQQIQPGIVAHGFRSTFRDWAGDETSYAREVAEAALAHKVGDATEQAYRRRKALAKRRKMMQAWADWCSRPSGQVLNMKQDKRQRPVVTREVLDAALTLSAPDRLRTRSTSG
jgi:integrase